MSEAIVYNFGTLNDASRNLSTGAAEVMAKLDEMRRRLEPLSGGFQGAASDSFHQLWEQWQDSGRRLQTSLDGLSTLLAAAAKNAAEMEDANRRIMTQSN